MSIYNELQLERADALSRNIEPAQVGPTRPSEAGFRRSLVIFFDPEVSGDLLSSSLDSTLAVCPLGLELVFEFLDLGHSLAICLWSPQTRQSPLSIRCCFSSEVSLPLGPSCWKGPRSYYTGGITKFSAKENFRKILKVSHFYLAFSPDENHDEIEHYHSILS